MKFISWNVNGLRACAGKDSAVQGDLFATEDTANDSITGFRTAVKALDADFFCLQETKMQAGQLDRELSGYQSYWNYAEKKGYSGTAIFTRHEPNHVYYGMGELVNDEIQWDEDSMHNHEGRDITVTMHACHLSVCKVTTFSPITQYFWPN